VLRQQLPELAHVVLVVLFFFLFIFSRLRWEEVDMVEGDRVGDRTASTAPGAGPCSARCTG